jgi:hypothetical protein
MDNTMKIIYLTFLAGVALVAPLHADTSTSTESQGSGGSGVQFVEAQAEVSRLRTTKPDSPELHSAEMRVQMIINQMVVNDDEAKTRAYYAKWQERGDQLRKDAEATAAASRQRSGKN